MVYFSETLQYHHTLRLSRTRARPPLQGWTAGALYHDRCSEGGCSVWDELFGLFIMSSANTTYGLAPNRHDKV